MKRITQIDPSSRVAVATADQYYETVHSPFAREHFLRDAPAMLRYGWNRVRGEYDLGGRFRQRPGAWRFVVSEWAEPQGGDEAGNVAATRLPPGLLDRLVADHVNFLSNMRPYDVTESVFFDARSGQLSLAKYVFTVAPAMPGAAAGRLLARLGDHLARATGARFGLDNVVRRQVATLPLDEPGQRYGEGFVREPALARVLELYFDNSDAGEEFFARRPVRALLADPDLVRGYAVEEFIAFDRRRPEA